MNKHLGAVLAFGVSALSASVALAGEKDPFMWLEEVEGEKPLAWVEEKNERSLADIKKYPGFQGLVDNAMEVLNNKDRIPYAGRNGDYYYNFWRDSDNPRGLYRRATLSEYKKESPKWETVLDIDALGKKEGVNWVYKGMNCLQPEFTRCMVALSRGGADAVEYREFDLNKAEFIKDGLYLPEAKSALNWVDKDTLIVGTDFGDGKSLTDSGYPRVLKMWHRGKGFKNGKTIFEAEQASVSARAYNLGKGKESTVFINDATDFYNANTYVYANDKLIAVDVPSDSDVEGLFKGNVYLLLKSDWKHNGKSFKQGSLLYSSLADIKAGKASFKLFQAPSEGKTIKGVAFTKNSLLISWLDNVRSSVVRYTPGKDGKWSEHRLELDDKAVVGLVDVDDRYEDFLVSYSSFIEPSTLYMFNESKAGKQKIKSSPSMFDGDRFKVEQFKAKSKDGTMIPYFVVMDKKLKFNGKNPTLLYGYGGFEISLLPRYSATIGKNWLEQGGVYVLSNIRGGGEFGPAWHQAALKENRHKAYEDFEAIAEDLIDRKITSPKHLGIQGGSNGGLLMGNAFTRRPDLYNAVVCQVPLLDMKRYNKLLAGASWMAEYGNPDIAEEWDFIKTFSPYHNVSKDKKYPKVFFTTSTRDDRVHPAHARKMVALMESQGHDVLYYENIEGGHAGAADIKQRAELSALAYAYLLSQLK
ncbi:prolyl oligopeptidase family serine peptidase [Pseudoteredinibacter isoporae]|uniref:Prolyl oligopeptidase n=1 Tax=Pseudoteredinibacter isoporae TaxID=570281 RepID=A0A7X0JWA1_9GAMM|nr:prolyl oligopeptidase family serine peptidase [Pseudoteredinibacter isoporae]MBB6523372.1 prolyl oligopeptidase [Pseudoteredinibacter isoporae]NHO88884.1 S9 family peptidase [Pseudoteredinibacter isoporae]NIB24408.1 S9 family peptidase [Pseudoteredinibacter isoporae]